MFLSKPFPDELEITSRGMNTVKYINSWSSDKLWDFIKPFPNPACILWMGGIQKYSSKLVLSVLLMYFCCRKAEY